MKDNKDTKFIDAKRRGFMQGAAVAGAATVTGAAATTAQAADLSDAVVKPESGDRYKDSDYVRAYYRNARF